jgi:hypothetical protein
MLQRMVEDIIFAYYQATTVAMDIKDYSECVIQEHHSFMKFNKTQQHSIVAPLLYFISTVYAFPPRLAPPLLPFRPHGDNHPIRLSRSCTYGTRGVLSRKHQNSKSELNFTCWVFESLEPQIFVKTPTRQSHRLAKHCQADSCHLVIFNKA